MPFITPAGTPGNTTANASTGPITLTRPASGVLGGHRLLMILGGVETDTTSDFTFTVPSGWTLVPGTSSVDADAAVRTKIEIYEHPAAGTAGAATTEPASYSVSATGISGKFGGVVLNYGTDTGPITVGTAKGTGASSTARSVSVTFTGDPATIVSVFLDAGGTYTTQDTERVEVTSTSSGMAVADSGTTVAAGTVTRTATSTLSTSVWSAVALAITPAPVAVSKVYMGSTAPKAFYVGSTPAKALYLGNTLVWGTAVSGGSTDPVTPTDTFRLLLDEPDIATNAGLGKYGRPAEGGLTPHSGTFTVTAAMSGQTISNLNISGNLIIDSGVTEVHFVNCLIRGVGFTGSDLIKINAPVSANITFDFCEIRSDDNWIGAIGIGRDGMVVRRCYVHHLTDAIRVTGNDTVVEGNVLGPLLLRTPDIQTRTDNKTHSDVIQIEGGARARIRGNKLFAMATTDGSSNVTHILSADPFTPTTSTDTNGRAHPQALSALMFTPNVGAVTDFLVEGNWIYGGEIAINAGSAGNSTSIGSIINNKFDRNQWYLGHTIDIDPTGTDITATGNVYMDNSAAVTVRRNA